MYLEHEQRPILLVGAGALGLRLAVILGAERPTLIVRRGDNSRVLITEEDSAGKPLVQVEVMTESLSRLVVIPEQAVIIICTKVHELHELLAALKRHILPSHTVVLAQNGLGIFEQAARLVGPEQIVRLSARFGAIKTAPWSIVPSGPVKVSLAALNTESPHLSDIEEIFLRLGGVVEIARTVDECEWQKALLNLLTNTLPTILNSSNGIILDDPDLWQTAVELISEYDKVATSAGISLGDHALEETIKASVSAVGSNINSTLADLRAGRPSELPWLIDRVIEVAEKNQITIPVTKALRAILKTMEEKGLLKR
jgi:2-dehydropantoate 2-reductase